MITLHVIKLGVIIIQLLRLYKISIIPCSICRIISCIRLICNVILLLNLRNVFVFLLLITHIRILFLQLLYLIRFKLFLCLLGLLLFTWVIRGQVLVILKIDILLNIHLLMLWILDLSWNLSSLKLSLLLLRLTAIWS
jgi:hypothetical protein